MFHATFETIFVSFVSFFQVIVLALQHLYMLLFYNDIIDALGAKKEVYSYTLPEEPEVNHRANIYKMGNSASKNVIVLLSGSFTLSFDTYIQKSAKHLLQDPYIAHDHLLIVYEKRDKQSFIVSPDVANYITYLNEEIEISELTLIGYSCGGVIASHVMSALKELKCKKKIITYDAPYQVMDNALTFETHTFFRLDYFFYATVYNVYLNHYNYNDIKQHLNSGRWCGGSRDILNMCYAVHNYSEEKYRALMGFNFDQDERTKIFEIYCEYDPVVDRGISDNYIKQHSKEDRVIKISKKIIGHCSDMWSPHYNIDDILNCLSE